jgi:hypothetical protein
MAATSGAAGADPSIGHCARLRRELSGEPDVGNLHLRFDEGRGTCSVPSYSTPRAPHKVLYQTKTSEEETTPSRCIDFRIILY